MARRSCSKVPAVLFSGRAVRAASSPLLIYDRVSMDPQTRVRHRAPECDSSPAVWRLVFASGVCPRKSGVRCTGLSPLCPGTLLSRVVLPAIDVELYFWQVRSLGSHAAEAKVLRQARRLDIFALDLLEEWTALHGSMVWRQVKRVGVLLARVSKRMSRLS